jgi:hypothetical protein
LHYSDSKGFTLGTVLNQVVNTVDNVLPSFKQNELTELITPSTTPKKNSILSPINDIKNEIDNVMDKKEKHIELEKWDEGVKSDVPSAINLPERWNQLLNFESGTSLLTEMKAQSIQLQITVRDGDDNDQENDGLCLNSNQYSENNINLSNNDPLINSSSIDDDNLSQALSPISAISCFTPQRSSMIPCFLRVSLVLEGEIETGKPKPYIVPAQGIIRNLNDLSNNSISNNETNSPFDHNSIMKSDVRFLFKNALVLVPVQPLPPPPDQNDIIVNNFDDSYDNISEDDGDESSDEIEVNPPQVESNRPLTARIRFTMQDPEPEIIPVPVIDYDLFALKIQICCRKRLSLTSKSAWTLQHFLKRYLIMKKWKNNVYLMIDKLNKSILIIQMKYRMFKSRSVVQLLRLQTNTALLNSVFGLFSDMLIPETWLSDDENDGNNDDIGDIDKLLESNNEELKDDINENIIENTNLIIKKKIRSKLLKDDDDEYNGLSHSTNEEINNNSDNTNDLINKLIIKYPGLINLSSDSDISEYFKQFNNNNDKDSNYIQEGCSWGSELLLILDLNELNSPNCIKLDDNLIYIELIEKDIIKEEKKKEMVNLTKEEILSLIIAENNNDYKHETKIQEQSIKKKDKIIKLGFGDVCRNDSNDDDLIINIIKTSIHDCQLNLANGYKHNNMKNLNINMEYKEVRNNLPSNDEKDFNLNDVFVDEDNVEANYNKSLGYPLLYTNVAQMFP